MNFIFQFILISIICCSFSNKIFCQGLTSKVLLLEYCVEVTDLKVLKDYKDKEKQFRYISVHPFNNPRFDKLAKRLDIDGLFDATDSSNVIFLGGGEAKEISFPFRYSKIKLDRLVNDSTVGFKLNNRKFISKPGQVVIDSLISIVKEGERVIQLTTKYRFENYGLIDKKNIFDSNDREIEIKKLLELLELEDTIKNNF